MPYHYLALLTIGSNEKNASYQEKGSWGDIGPIFHITRGLCVILPFLKDCSWAMFKLLSLGMAPTLALVSAPVDILSLFS